MSIIDDQALMRQPLSSNFMDGPVRDLLMFDHAPPDVEPATWSLVQSRWGLRPGDLMWYNLTFTEDSPIGIPPVTRLVGRLGIKARFDDSKHRMAYTAATRGDWESTSGKQCPTWVGFGIPSAHPDAERGVGQSLEILFVYLGRVSALFIALSKFADVLFTIQAWTHPSRTLTWFVILSFWSWNFRIEMLPSQFVLLILGGLSFNYFQFLSGAYLVTALQPKSTQTVNLRAAKIYLSVQDVKLSSQEIRSKNLLHIHCDYVPGDFDYDDEFELNTERSKSFPVGDFSQCHDQQVGRVNMTVRGRKKSLTKRLLEAGNLRPSSSFPFIKVKPAPPGRCLADRSFLWQVQPAPTHELHHESVQSPRAQGQVVRFMSDEFLLILLLPNCPVLSCPDCVPRF